MSRELLSKQYPKASALYIMDLVNRLLVDAESGGIDFLEFRDDAENSPGVYVSKVFGGMFPQGEAGLEAGNMLAWKPACDMENGPHAMTAPSLPETFTAAELAAFMLYGPGEAIQELLGPIGSLDETALLKIGGKQGKWEQEALGAAYEAARQAQDVVGAPDFEADDYVSRDAWIKAMVRQLLEPPPETPEQPAEIEPQALHLAEQPAGVELEPVKFQSDSPAAATPQNSPEVAQARRTRTDNLKRAIFDAWNEGFSPDAPVSELFDYLVRKDDTGFIRGRDGNELAWENSSGEISRTSIKALSARLPEYRKQHSSSS